MAWRPQPSSEGGNRSQGEEQLSQAHSVSSEDPGTETHTVNQLLPPKPSGSPFPINFSLLVGLIPQPCVAAKSWR